MEVLSSPKYMPAMPRREASTGQRIPPQQGPLLSSRNSNCYSRDPCRPPGNLTTPAGTPAALLELQLPQQGPLLASGNSN